MVLTILILIFGSQRADTRGPGKDPRIRSKISQIWKDLQRDIASDFCTDWRTFETVDSVRTPDHSWTPDKFLVRSEKNFLKSEELLKRMVLAILILTFGSQRADTRGSRGGLARTPELAPRIGQIWKYFRSVYIISREYDWYSRPAAYWNGPACTSSRCT